jgi:hypothetical protein
LFPAVAFQSTGASGSGPLSVGCGTAEHAKFHPGHADAELKAKIGDTTTRIRRIQS